MLAIDYRRFILKNANKKGIYFLEVVWIEKKLEIEIGRRGHKPFRREPEYRRRNACFDRNTKK